MFIAAKDHIKRCPECRTVVTMENDGFCHDCGEFFCEEIGNRWFDDTGKMDDFNGTCVGMTFPPW